MARIVLVVLLVGGPLVQAFECECDQAAPVAAQHSFGQQSGPPSSDPVDDDDLQTHDDDDDDDLSLGAGEPAKLLELRFFAEACPFGQAEPSQFPGSIDQDPPLHVPRA